MSNDTDDKVINDIKIDPKKAINVLNWLVQRETINVKTKERTDAQMVIDIQKRIEEEDKQCY
jgi:alpha-D-ribose 1-methylphosphonate 5-phosphate C-P lyase